MCGIFHHLCVLPSGERTWLIVNHHDRRSERLLQLKDMRHIEEVAHLICCSLIKESTRMIYQQPHAPTSLAFWLKLQTKVLVHVYRLQVLIQSIAPQMWACRSDLRVDSVDNLTPWQMKEPHLFGSHPDSRFAVGIGLESIAVHIDLFRLATIQSDTFHWRISSRPLHLQVPSCWRFIGGGMSDHFKSLGWILTLSFGAEVSPLLCSVAPSDDKRLVLQSPLVPPSTVT